MRLKVKIQKKRVPAHQGSEKRLAPQPIAITRVIYKSCFHFQHPPTCVSRSRLLHKSSRALETSTFIWTQHSQLPLIFCRAKRRRDSLLLPFVRMADKSVSVCLLFYRNRNSSGGALNGNIRAGQSDNNITGRDDHQREVLKQGREIWSNKLQQPLGNAPAGFLLREVQREKDQTRQITKDFT